MPWTVRSPSSGSTVERPDLGPYEPAWDELVTAAPLPSPFLRSWWLTACRTPSTRFVLVVDGDRLLGGAFVDERRWFGCRVVMLDAGGRLAPDHLDLVAADGAADAVTSAVTSWLADRSPCVVEVRGAREGATVARALPGPVRSRVIAPAPYAVLPSDPAEYFAARPSWLRNTVTRGRKRLRRDGVEYRQVAGGDDLDRALTDLRRLHADRWASETNFLLGFDRFAAAARLGAACGEVVVHELVAPTGVVASMATFDVAKRSSFYQSGRSTDPAWRSAGTVLMAMVLDEACRAGTREFDFLRGGEPYKEAWATGSRDVVHLRASSGGWAGVVAGGLTTRDHVRARVADVVRRRRAARSGG